MYKSLPCPWEEDTKPCGMVDVESLLISFSSNSIKSHHCVHYLAGNLIFSRKKSRKRRKLQEDLGHYLLLLLPQKTFLFCACKISDFGNTWAGCKIFTKSGPSEIPWVILFSSSRYQSRKGICSSNVPDQSTLCRTMINPFVLSAIPFFQDDTSWQSYT